MLAIGDFALVEDDMEDLEVNYLVEPEYEDDAMPFLAIPLK